MREKQVNNNCDDKVLYDELDKEEDPQKEYLSLINNLIITTSGIETESEKQLVNVVRGIDLESGKNILEPSLENFLFYKKIFVEKRM